MDGIVGITGTPGTGKKSVAPLVAARLRFKCYGLNDLARSLGTLEPSDPEGVVDTRKLRLKLRNLDGPAVVYGHLLPYAVEKDSVSRMAVLRCEPKVLKRRLKARGYPARKVLDNVEAELIGLESSDAFDSFGQDKTFEVDTTRSTPAKVSDRIVGVIRGQSKPSPRLDWVQAYDTGPKLRSLLSAES